MSQLIQVLIGGLTLSGIYLLVATGINVVFGQTRIVNFAHGQFLVVAGLVSWELTSNGAPYPVAVVVSVIGVALGAALLEFVLLRRVSASPLASFLLTLGVLLLLTQATTDRYTTLPHQLQSPVVGHLTVFGARMSYASIIVTGASTLTAMVLFGVLRWTRMGRKVRASTEDPVASRHVGIAVNRVAAGTFVVGSALTAWAGCLLALLYPLSSGSGGTYLIKGFAVALLGGLGSIVGGVVAALFLGLIEQIATGYWKPAWVPGLSGMLIIVVLLVRPSGLFGLVRGSTESRESFLPRFVRLPKHSNWMTVAALTAAFFLPSVGLSNKVSSLATFAALYAIVAVGVGFLFRETGILSFGHGAFWAAGAYWAALVTDNWGVNSWLVMGAGVVLGGVLALFIGFPILRTRGFYFVIITFAIADLGALVLTNLSSLTGGGRGVTVLKTPNAFFGVKFETSAQLYRLILVVLCVCLLTVWLISRSPFGRRLEAIRDNEVLARSLGLHVHGYQVLAFAISGAIAGLGGVLFLYFNSALTPSQFTGFATVSFPLMVILGGSRSRTGPLIGAVVLTFLPFWLNFGPAGTQYAQGIALVVLMIGMPEGIGPGVVRLFRKVADVAVPHRRRPTEAGPASGIELAAIASEMGRTPTSTDRAEVTRG